MADNSTPHSSSNYDAQVRETIPYYESFHRETIDLIQALPVTPQRWLDTGCGTGTLVEQAFTLFPHTQFLLADPSEGMMAEASRKLGAYSADRMQLLDPVATQNLPAAFDGTFDVITAIQSHHYLTREGRENATGACYRLLVPGGVYVTFENIRPLTAEGLAIGKARWKAFQLSRGKSPDAVENHLKRFDTEYLPITVEEHLALLHSTGFRAVELFWYSCMQAGFFAMK